MPVCLDCKEEYREGFSVCADCGELLVESLPDKPTEECVFVELSLLCSIDDDVNADILAATLKKNGITPLMQKHGAGGYLTIYMGMNTFGVSIYVPVDKLESAKEIFHGIMPNDDNPVENLDETDEFGEEFEAKLNRAAKNKSIIGWLLLIWFVGGVDALIVLILGILF